MNKACYEVKSLTKDGEVRSVQHVSALCGLPQKAANQHLDDTLPGWQTTPLRWEAPGLWRLEVYNHATGYGGVVWVRELLFHPV